MGTDGEPIAAKNRFAAGCIRMQPAGVYQKQAASGLLKSVESTVFSLSYFLMLEPGAALTTFVSPKESRFFSCPALFNNVPWAASPVLRRGADSTLLLTISLRRLELRIQYAGGR